MRMKGKRADTRREKGRMIDRPKHEHLRSFHHLLNGMLREREKERERQREREQRDCADDSRTGSYSRRINHGSQHREKSSQSELDTNQWDSLRLANGPRRLLPKRRSLSEAPRIKMYR